MAIDKKLSARIKSLRLRTLPLSLSGVCLGLFLAFKVVRISFPVAALVLLTTVCLQILSNLSNELGDVLSGTDTQERQGPQYGLDNGVLSITEMKRMIWMFAALSAVLGAAMVWVSFGSLFKVESICLLALGAAAITAATRYTLGKNPYGYRGLGDASVFIFFGLASVLGSYFVAAHFLTWPLLLPAAAIGCFSVGVLNVNNIRDIKTDSATRVTVAIKLGVHRARVYQTALIAAGWAAMLTFTVTHDICDLGLSRISLWRFIYVLTLPLYIIHLKGVWTKKDRELDPMLPLLVMSTFAFALLAGLGFLI